MNNPNVNHNVRDVSYSVNKNATIVTIKNATVNTLFLFDNTTAERMNAMMARNKAIIRNI